MAKGVVNLTGQSGLRAGSEGGPRGWCSGGSALRPPLRPEERQRRNGLAPDSLRRSAFLTP